MLMKGNSEISAPSRESLRPLFLKQKPEKGEGRKGLLTGCVCSASYGCNHWDFCMGVRGVSSVTLLTNGKGGLIVESPRSGGMSQAGIREINDDKLSDWEPGG